MPRAVPHVEKHFAYRRISTPIPVVLSLIETEMGVLAPNPGF